MLCQSLNSQLINKQIKLCKVLAHKGIKGNDKAENKQQELSQDQKLTRNTRKLHTRSNYALKNDNLKLS